jgi:hypothetical protein
MLSRALALCALASLLAVASAAPTPDSFAKNDGFGKRDLGKMYDKKMDFVKTFEPGTKVRRRLACRRLLISLTPPRAPLLAGQVQQIPS